MPRGAPTRPVRIERESLERAGAVEVEGWPESRVPSLCMTVGADFIRWVRCEADGAELPEKVELLTIELLKALRAKWLDDTDMVPRKWYDDAMEHVREAHEMMKDRDRTTEKMLALMREITGKNE